MMRPAFSKSLFALVSVLALICLAEPASARHNGGSHSGKSHGGGSFHGGGHSKGASFKAPSFKGGGHSYTSGGGNSRFSSARMGGASKNRGWMGGDSYTRSAGFSSRPSGNLTRGSSFKGGSFGSSTSSHTFEHFGRSQPVTQASRGAASNWQSFGNSFGRPMLASARTSGNATSGGWRPSGNTFGQDGGAAMPRGFGNRARTEGQWRSFGNFRSNSFGRNISGFSSFSAARTTGSNARWGGFQLGSNRFSSSGPAYTRGSSISSFYSGRSMTNFGGTHFGDSRLGDSGFGNSSFGGSGFLTAGIGSGVSVFPNLLDGFLNIGTTLFGGPGDLAANALSVAVRLFVSGIEASGAGQGDFSGGDVGPRQPGFGGNFGLQAGSVDAACGPRPSPLAEGTAWGGYCGPTASQSFGSTSIGDFGGPRTRISFNYH